MKNKGYSLVEVVITVAIMSIVLACVLQLMVVGSKMYTKTSISADVQTEAQLLESQLNNLIVDAECGVYAQVKAEGGTAVTDTSGFTADAYIKVFNYNVAYYIAWDEDSQKIFYLEKTVTDGVVADLTTDEQDVTNWYLMGEGVSNFVPDTSHVTNEQRLVTVRLEVTKRDEHYVTVQNICLRNNVLESNELGEIYSGEAVDGELIPTAVTVSPQVVSANRGTNTVFSAVVSSNGQIVPSQEVVWDVTGETSAGTYIASDGTLTIGWDETASVLNITATAKDSVVFAKACAIIPNVNGISVTVNDDSPSAGSGVLFTATVTGDNLDAESKKINWTIDTQGITGVTLSQNGVLNIGKNVLPGTEIVVRATAAATSGMTSPVSGTCKVTVSSLNTDGFVIEGSNAVLNRNGTVYLSASLDGNDMSGANIEWSIENDAGLGDKITLTQNGALSASGDINYSKSYQIVVKAETRVATLGKKYEATFYVTINRVTIEFESNVAVVVKGNTVRFPYTVTGLENAGADISVTSSPSVSNTSGSFMYCTADELVVTIGSGVNKSNLTVTASVKGSSAVQGSVVVYIKDASNVSGSRVYIPVPSEGIGSVSADSFTRVEGTNNSNTVVVSIGDKTITYWVSYADDSSQTYNMRMDQTTYYYDSEAGLWKKSI